MGRVTGYSVVSYGDMVTDQPRMSAYYEALQKSVRPGDVVVDIGAGTGIFSLLACRFGAAHVHAIEPNNAIQVAIQSASANGFADRITFHQKLSTEVVLDKPADVIVSDLRGVLPLLENHITTISDARRRLLTPGGVVIPRRDFLWAALVEAPKIYRPYEEPWIRNDYELDLSAGKPMVVNNWRKANASEEWLLVPPQQWAELDYATIESPAVKGELNWTIERPGVAHGLLLWFDAELAQGVGFSNAPGCPEMIYGQGFFPLQNPIELSPGDSVSVKVKADLADNNYVWRWQTQVRAQGISSFKANYSQSTFFGAPIALETLRKKETSFQPAINNSGRADRLILDLMDGSNSLTEIAERVWQEFPSEFADRKEALTRAGELSVKYAR